MTISLISLFVVWVLVTLALIVVAIYRGFLAKDETDHIFVNQSQNRLATRQNQIIAKVSRLDNFVKGLALASGGLLVVCTVVWLWSSLFSL
jgi:hypothetical protein